MPEPSGAMGAEAIVKRMHIDNINRLLAAFGKDPSKMSLKQKIDEATRILINSPTEQVKPYMAPETYSALTALRATLTQSAKPLMEGAQAKAQISPVTQVPSLGGPTSDFSTQGTPGKFSVPSSTTATTAATGKSNLAIHPVEAVQGIFDSANKAMIAADPCSNLPTGKERYACYTKQVGKLLDSNIPSAIDETSGPMAYYLRKQTQAQLDAETEAKDYENEIALETERANIQNQIRQRQMEATQLLTGAAESALSAKTKMLNEGIVMAPGQEYLYGQEPGGWQETAMRTPWVGTPGFTAQKFPHMPLNTNAPLEEARAGLAKTDIPGFGTTAPSLDLKTPPQQMYEAGGGTMPTPSLGMGGTQQAKLDESTGAPLSYPTGPITGGDYRIQFYNQMLPYARRIESKYGIPADYTIAIAANETGYGKAGTSPFGIKGSGTAGSYKAKTFEIVNGKRVDITDTFAQYNNLDEAFEHFATLINNSRYKGWEKYIGDPASWATYLQTKGYATSPTWGSQIGSIVNMYRSLRGG